MVEVSVSAALLGSGEGLTTALKEAVAEADHLTVMATALEISVLHGTIVLAEQMAELAIGAIPKLDFDAVKRAMVMAIVDLGFKAKLNTVDVNNAELASTLNHVLTGLAENIIGNAIMGLPLELKTLLAQEVGSTLGHFAGNETLDGLKHFATGEQPGMRYSRSVAKGQGVQAHPTYLPAPAHTDLQHASDHYHNAIRNPSNKPAHKQTPELFKKPTPRVSPEFDLAAHYAQRKWHLEAASDRSQSVRRVTTLHPASKPRSHFAGFYTEEGFIGNESYSLGRRNNPLPANLTPDQQYHYLEGLGMNDAARGAAVFTSLFIPGVLPTALGVSGAISNALLLGPRAEMAALSSMADMALVSGAGIFVGGAAKLAERIALPTPIAGFADRNVFCINSNNEILWQIEIGPGRRMLPGGFDYDSFTYIDFNGNELMGKRFSGFEYHIDLMSGRIKETGWNK